VVTVDGKKKHVKVELDGAIPSAHTAAKPAESKEHAAKKAGEKEEEGEEDEEDEDDEGGGK
jgi:ribosomal protein L12E/L44/L45/RPP1/RPP2